MYLKEPLSGLYFIGINDQATKDQWVYSSSGQSVSTTFWRSDQPNEVGTAHCVYLGGTCTRGGEWCDGSCSKSYFSVCEIADSNVNFSQQIEELRNLTTIKDAQQDQHLENVVASAYSQFDRFSNTTIDTTSTQVYPPN